MSIDLENAEYPVKEYINDLYKLFSTTEFNEMLTQEFAFDVTCKTTSLLLEMVGIFFEASMEQMEEDAFYNEFTDWA